VAFGGRQVVALVGHRGQVLASEQIGGVRPR
jgi:hypothetical protein